MQPLRYLSVCSGIEAASVAWAPYGFEEAGEACNVIKKLVREEMGLRGSRATKEQLAEELADAVNCADLVATQAGIDLDDAVRAKFNATSEKHGFKTRLGMAKIALPDWPAKEKGLI